MYVCTSFIRLIFFNIVFFVFLAIVKSSKNVKRRVLWIKRNFLNLKKKWYYHQYSKGDIFYLSKVKHKNKVGLLNFNRRKKSKFLVNKIYSWKFLKIRNSNFKSTIISIPFLFK